MDEVYPLEDRFAASNETSSALRSDVVDDTLPSEDLTVPSEAVRPVEGSVGQMLASIVDQLGELQREFTTKIQFDESKQRQLDLMHQELEQHRQGMVTQIVRPILMDLISLYDDLTGLIEGNADQAPQVANMLRNQLQSVEAILNRHGVDVYVSPNETFDRAHQRAISTIDTSDEKLDQHVAQRLRNGFMYDGRTLRPEFVDTYRYRRPTE